MTLLVGAASFCCMGVALTAVIPSEDAAAPITNATVLPLYFLSGVFIPQEEIPDPVLDFSSIFPIRHDRYGIPLSPRHPYVLRRPVGSIIEAPASTVRFGPANLPVGGGGYFRILPYSWAEWGIARLNDTEKAPAIFYLHPWEIDPDQPRLQAGLVSRFRHYRNLGDTERRLGLLLRRFAFGPLREMLRITESTASASAAEGLPYLW